MQVVGAPSCHEVAKSAGCYDARAQEGGQEPRTRLRTSSPRALAAWCTPAAALRPLPPGRAAGGSQSPWHPERGTAEEKLRPTTFVRAPRSPGASSRARIRGADHSRARGGEAAWRRVSAPPSTSVLGPGVPQKEAPGG